MIDRSSGRPGLVCLAAASPAELASLTEACAAELDAHGEGHFHRWLGARLPQSGRYRLAVVADSAPAAADGLRAALLEHRERDPRPRFAPPEVAFVFPGQGGQRRGMGLELAPLKPFDDALAAIDPTLRAYLGAPLAEALTSSDLEDTSITQPAIVALACALAETLRAFGVVPTAALGHSVGELGAAWLAGCLSLDGALALVTLRASLMAGLPERGRMALIRAAEHDVRALLVAPVTPVSIAALNGPSSTVIAGPSGAVAEVLARAADRGLKTRPVAIPQASHCALLDPMLERFEREAAAHDDSTTDPSMPLASTLFGTLFGLGVCPERPDAAYWRRHAREPVRFESAALALADRGVEVFIELGPEPSLARLGLAQHTLWLPVLDPRRRPLDPLAELLAELFRRGADIDARSLSRLD